MSALREMKGILTGLQTLAPWQAGLFGASCAQRLAAVYREFQEEVGWGGFQQLSAALEAVWQTLERAGSFGIESGLLAAHLEKCEEAAPDADEFESSLTGCAQDAVFAVCNLLDFVSSRDVKHVASVAEHAINVADYQAQELEGMDAQGPELESMILAHPLMQRELSRQRRDIADVSRFTVNSIDEIRAFAERARGESVVP